MVDIFEYGKSFVIENSCFSYDKFLGLLKNIEKLCYQNKKCFKVFNSQ